MPRVTLIRPRPPVERNDLEELIRVYKRERGQDWADVAEYFHLSTSAMKAKAGKPDKWTLGDLMTFRKALDIPGDELSKTIELMMEG